MTHGIQTQTMSSSTPIGRVLLVLARLCITCMVIVASDLREEK
jgi:hypothetical protein